VVRRALVCAPLMPEYDRESGGQSIFDLVMYLRDTGWAVSFAAQNPAEGARYRRQLQQQGVAVYAGFSPRLEELITYGELDLAIFAFWYIAEELLPQVRAGSPTTRVAVNTMDLHFLRNARRAFTAWRGSVGQLGAEAASEFARELNVYAASDAVFTVSAKEAAILNDFIGDPGLAHVVADNEPMESSPHGFSNRSGVVFVGNFRHPPNIEAVEYLCKEVVPRLNRRLLARHPLYIVGNDLHRKGVAKFADGVPGVRMVGWVPSLTPYYHKARVAVSPVLHGAGTKRKVLQALMAKTPTVSTTLGLEGFNLEHGRDVLVADDPTSFAASIERLLQDGALWRKLSQNGRARVAARYERANVQRQFVDVLERVLAREPKKVDVDEGQLAELRVAKRARYARLIERIKAATLEALPPASRVAVASRGDDELLNLNGHEGWHYPQTRGGIYAGHHPANSAEAIGELEKLRARGAQFLMLPSTALWWLDQYPEFREYLQRNCRKIFDERNTCLIYALS
jgi:glycosyltransferase involved in cell wall biosynthesis